MEHESFADEATAAVMNELFVNVKVDREERPDVDAVYMDAVVALTGQGGWPLTVFLTPDGEPFFGGTYFPPEPRHGLPLVPPGAARRGGRVPGAAGGRRRAGRGARRRAAALGRDGAVPRAADRGAARRGRARPALAARPALGRVRPRAEVPARVGPGVPAPARRARSGPGHARRDGGRRDVRPRRRRLPPLLRRPAVARAALREDALRQRAPRAAVPPRVAAHRRGAVPRRRGADPQLPGCASCGCPAAVSPRPRTRTPTASRG